MPTQESNVTALVPAPEYMITVKDFDAAGAKTELSMSLPESTNFAEWTARQQIVMLKKGMWSAISVPDIIIGLVYARSIDADPLKGDIFPTGVGRWGTSNKYKIRKANETGNIVGIQVEMKDLKTPISLDKCVQKTDLECTVKISVKGWVQPIVRTARLSRWYKGSNPNWQGNPEHMLELNTIAHACEFVPGTPIATEDDEAPPTPPLQDLAQAAVAQARSNLTTQPGEPK
jgi:hypothetical protein